MIKIIAEAGCNHMGDMEIAKHMIERAAHFCNADVIKFQKRCNKELLPPEVYNASHPNPENSYGKTYGEHREFLEFSQDQHLELLNHCKIHQITYSSSVWDLTSAKEIAELEPELIKIPSAVNNNFDMLDWLCKNYKGTIHCSLGMTTVDELSHLADFLLERDRLKDTVLYSCTSGYPVPFEEICLYEIKNLKRKWGHLARSIGFSGHHLGIGIDNAAVALGAKWIERHFTLDRTWKGTDHAASLEPDGFRKLVRDIRATEKALKYKDCDLLPIELSQRKKLKYVSKKVSREPEETDPEISI